MLYDTAPHSCSLYTATSADDGGGGTALSYSLALADVPCSINTASSATDREYGQDHVTVTHTIGILSDLLTTAVAVGMKVVDDQSNTFILQGIRSPNRAYGSIPQLTYLDCKQIR